VLSWPRRDGPAKTARAGGAYVVLSDGDPVLYLERGGRALQTLTAPDDPGLWSGLTALVEHVRAGRIKRLALEKIDGQPALTSSLAPRLVELGFNDGPRRLTLSA
jgi:ATP-dependent Lhr-like helicase